MKLEWMRCFVEIAEKGSINKAAEELYLSQPAVTKMIQALEKELAVELLWQKKNRCCFNCARRDILTLR